MKEWSVELQAVTPQPPDEDLAERLLDQFADRGAAVSLEKDRVCVRFDVQADTSIDAMSEAIGALLAAFPDLDIVRAQVEEVDELERRLALSNAPELLGVAEVAEALGVTKQRVSELAAQESFPVPIARLRSGPIWQRSALARFMSSWTRRPGRRPAGRT